MSQDNTTGAVPQRRRGGGTDTGTLGDADHGALDLRARGARLGMLPRGGVPKCSISQTLVGMGAVW